MNLDNILSGEKELIDEVVQSAKEDVKENPAPDHITPENDIEFETKEKEFGAEDSQVYEEADILDDEIFGGGGAGQNSGGGTATVDNQYSENQHIYEGLSDMDKKRNFLYCQLYVMMMNQVGELTFKLIAGEFGNDTGGDYSMNKTKQNEIAKAWAEVLNIEMSVKTPKSALAFLVVGSMLPMLIMSIKTRYKKTKEKRSNKETAEHKAYTEDVTEARDQEIVDLQKQEFKKEYPEKQDETIIITPTFTRVDEKGTAEVLQTEIPKEKEEAPKQIATATKGKRGAKRGGMTNPNTGVRELFTHVIDQDGKPYYVYSWGAKKLIPKKHRNNG